ELNLDPVVRRVHLDVAGPYANAIFEACGDDGAFEDHLGKPPVLSVAARAEVLTHLHDHTLRAAPHAFARRLEPASDELAEAVVGSLAAQGRDRPGLRHLGGQVDPAAGLAADRLEPDLVHDLMMGFGAARPAEPLRRCAPPPHKWGGATSP